jgi:D-galactarolactone cycloisomerase
VKITGVQAFGLQGATPRGGWSAELAADDVAHTLIVVSAEDGSVGIGSAFTTSALAHAALEVLVPVCVGEHALEPERVSERLHQQTFWFGRGGAVTHTISGIDIALWDLLGQAAGQPVGRLLGGRYRDRVRPYASVLADEPKRLADTLRGCVAAGFRAVKIGWGPLGRVDAALDRAIVSAARTAVGPDVLLAVDAGASDGHWSQGLRWALATAAMLADHGVAWFEEPLPPDDFDGYAELRRRQDAMPIAGGEVLCRRQEFARFLRAGTVDIVQPDTTKGGGLSVSRRVGWMAEEHGVRLVPHGWNTAIGLAADLHLASSLPHTDLVEYHTGSPYIDELVDPPFRLDSDGMLAIPDGPGLGVRLDTGALRRWYKGELELP